MPTQLLDSPTACPTAELGLGPEHPRRIAATRDHERRLFLIAVVLKDRETHTKMVTLADQHDVGYEVAFELLNQWLASNPAESEQLVRRLMVTSDPYLSATATRYALSSLATSALPAPVEISTTPSRPRYWWIGQNITARKQEAGWSFVEMAEIVGMAKSSLQDVCAGRSNPSPEMLTLIADAFTLRANIPTEVEDLTVQPAQGGVQ